MVSHTTRLVCYAIPLRPGPSHLSLSLSIYLSIYLKEREEARKNVRFQGGANGNFRQRG